MGNGKFVWRDLQTSDVAASKTFFTGLFGWTLEDVDMAGMTYTMFGVNGENIGGIMPLDAGSGAPSHWSSYLSVEDVDAAAETAKQNGGTLYFGPDDIPEVGRFAVMADPQGATFNLFKNIGDYQSPADVMPTPVGGVSWNELETSDPKAAMEFYGKLVDWSIEKSTMASTMDYWIAKQGEEYRAGIMEKPPMLPVSCWFIYFAVADIDAAVAKARELGGVIWMDVITVEGIGKVTYGADPTGAAYAMIQEAPM